MTGATHSALIYDDLDEFASTVGTYLAEGVQRDERVLAVLPAAKHDRVRDALGSDARAVEFADAAENYRPQWKAVRAILDSLAETPGRPLRLVGEQDLARRSRVEVIDYRRLEAALNVIFHARPVTMLCPYDAGSLPDHLVDIGRRTHDSVLDSHGRRPNTAYADPAGVLLGLATVTQPPADASSLPCDRPADLAVARRFVRAHALQEGLAEDAVDDLALAVTEVLTNALRHGAPPHRLHVYDEGDALVCHVHDGGSGPLDATAGYSPPATASDHGYGLWLARQLCDAVEIGVDESGMHVRLHARRPYGG